jgi:octaprenyl-diphosphate synthase
VNLAWDGVIESGVSHEDLTPDDAVRAVEETMSRVVAHGGGILATIAADHLASGGKRVRARLALTAAFSLGVPRRSAAPWAAAVELVHNASLVHDDL